jgi:translation initiation factor 4G
LNTGASTFFPRKITIKTQEGREVDFGIWRKKDAPASPVVENNAPLIHQTHQKRISVVRMETVEAKEKRLAEEKEKEERARKAEEEKRAAEDEKKRKEEEEKKKVEDEEKRKKEEAERKRKEEEEEAERERIRKEEQEKERIRKEEEAKKAAEEEERKRKEKEEEERKVAEAEKLRLAQEAEERRVREEEKRVAAKLAEEQKPEEGEIVDSPASEAPPKEVREVFSRKEGLKIDTSITKTRPGPLDLSGATKNVVAAPPSALATARIIEDLGHISYPEGVTSPRPELNVNSKNGKFR